MKDAEAKADKPEANQDKGAVSDNKKRKRMSNTTPSREIDNLSTEPRKPPTKANSAQEVDNIKAVDQMNLVHTDVTATLKSEDDPVETLQTNEMVNVNERT